MTASANRHLTLAFAGHREPYLARVKVIHPQLCDGLCKPIPAAGNNNLRSLGGKNGMRAVMLFFLECAIGVRTEAGDPEPLELIGSRPSLASSLYDALEKKDERGHTWKSHFGFLIDGGLAEPFLNCVIAASQRGRQEKQYVVGLRFESGQYAHLSPTDIDVFWHDKAITGNSTKLKLLRDLLIPNNVVTWEPVGRGIATVSCDGSGSTAGTAHVALCAQIVTATPSPSTEFSMRSSLSRQPSEVTGLPPTLNLDAAHSRKIGAVESTSGVTLLELTIACDFDAFTPDQERALMAAIRGFVKGRFKVVLKQPGSVKLTLEVSSEDADTLLRVVQAGRLSSHCVTSAKIHDEEEVIAIEKLVRASKIKADRKLHRMAEKTDEELLAAYRTGDNNSFPLLIERYQRELIHFLVRFLGDRAAAEDTFQETFLQVQQSAGQFDPRRRFRPWLFTIAANKARDLMRSQARRPTNPLQATINANDDDSGQFIDLMQSHAPIPGDASEHEEFQKVIQITVEAMPEHLREILLLSYFHQFPYKEISDILQIPLGTVKSRLHAAVANFAIRWENRIQRTIHDSAAMSNNPGERSRWIVGRGMLSNDDRCAVDLLLENAQPSVQTCFSQAISSTLQERLTRVESLLQLLEHNVVPEPAKDLASRTLARIQISRTRIDSLQSHAESHYMPAKFDC